MAIERSCVYYYHQYRFWFKIWPLSISIVYLLFYTFFPPSDVSFFVIFSLRQVDTSEYLLMISVLSSLFRRSNFFLGHFELFNQKTSINKQRNVVFHHLGPVIGFKKAFLIRSKCLLIDMVVDIWPAKECVQKVVRENFYSKTRKYRYFLFLAIKTFQYDHYCLVDLWNNNDNVCSVRRELKKKFSIQILIEIQRGAWWVD